MGKFDYLSTFITIVHDGMMMNVLAPTIFGTILPVMLITAFCLP